MQHDHFQPWTQFYQAVSTPLAELTELNLKTMTHMYEKNGAIINQFITNKKPDEIKPEDLLSAQVKLAVETNACAIGYCQEASTIFRKAVTDFIKQCQTAAGDMAKGASTFATSSKSKTTEKERSSAV